MDWEIRNCEGEIPEKKTYGLGDKVFEVFKSKTYGVGHKVFETPAKKQTSQPPHPSPLVSMFSVYYSF